MALCVFASYKGGGRGATDAPGTVNGEDDVGLACGGEEREHWQVLLKS
jgi:hypothetical protein